MKLSMLAQTIRLLTCFRIVHFESHLPIVPTGMFRGFLSPSKQLQWQYLKKNHGDPLSNLLHSIIHDHHNIYRCITAVADSISRLGTKKN
jgi:hypothetical protein